LESLEEKRSLRGKAHSFTTNLAEITTSVVLLATTTAASAFAATAAAALCVTSDETVTVSVRGGGGLTGDVEEPRRKFVSSLEVSLVPLATRSC
jgi:hypothetical protein